MGRVQFCTMSTDQDRQGQRWKIAAIFIFVFALYFLTRSPDLDEWDSVQFAWGVRGFDLWNHHPHPPGYPLYILAGWMGNAFWHWEPVFSLEIASCLGGALFVAAWFLIVRLQFGEKLAWLVGASLTITPVVWMTSTKVLTDSLASGLLSAQLLCMLLYRGRGCFRDLILAACFGAAGTGVRPQLFLVALVILIGPLAERKCSAKIWYAGIGAFILGCLFWLTPMWYLQARLDSHTPAWLVYPEQIYQQWRWRLDKPDVFIGAGDFSPRYLGERFAVHILGWFGFGLGFVRFPFTIAAGSLLTGWGLIAYWFGFNEEDREFWRAHWVWMMVHVLIIYCFLPGDQRYYLLVMPLILVVLLRGFLALRKPWRFVAIALPLLLLGVSIPVAMQSRNQEAPPVRLVRFLQQQYPFPERRGVLLFLGISFRHFEWYAPEFDAIEADSLAAVKPERLASARAIYTEYPTITLPEGWRIVPVAHFERSVVIYPKHHTVTLFRVERSAAL